MSYLTTPVVWACLESGVPCGSRSQQPLSVGVKSDMDTSIKSQRNSINLQVPCLLAAPRDARCPVLSLRLNNALTVFIVADFALRTLIPQLIHNPTHCARIVADRLRI